MLLGLAVVAGTEGLGAAGLLRPVPVASYWIATLVLAGWCWRPRLRMPRWMWWEWALFAGVAAVLGIIGFTALRAAPNSADAMAYHLPRVVYWKQMGSVRFFPTSYLNQITLGPLAEYFMLHTWLLSGGDRLVNLVQWFGCAGSVTVAWLLAGELGASRMGQWLAAVFVATLPNGVLQASGAKNDYLLTLWLLCAVFFAARRDWWFLGIAVGLALLTKATAYLFLPVALLPLLSLMPWRAIGSVALIGFTINAPQYWRNFDLSGSVIGFDSAHGDGKYRWQNQRFGVRETVSNVVRHASEQLGGRSDAWNQRVYQAVERIHGALAMDLNDPATTWPEARFTAPRNANHEANAHNRWHLLLGIVSFAIALVRREWKMAIVLGCLFGGFVLFAAYLKWQPFMQRLLLPLFALAGPAVGVVLGRWRALFIGMALCLFLLNGTRPYLFENWTRRLRGPGNVLVTSRLDQYFNDTVQFGVLQPYLAVIEEAKRHSCRSFAIDMSRFELEYPFQAHLLATDASSEFAHANVTNASRRFGAPSNRQPCAVVCLACGPNGKFLYSELP